MGRLLVTGFGPFGRVKVNPSEALVCSLEGFETKILPVSFRSVDGFLKKGLPRGYDRLLMLGVCGPVDRMRVELVARNRIGKQSDVDGEVRGRGPIDVSAPDALEGSLFTTWRHRTMKWKPSRNAGNYLCNYAYFRALCLLPRERVGFLHVPPTSSVKLELQREWLSWILQRLEREG